MTIEQQLIRQIWYHIENVSIICDTDKAYACGTIDTKYMLPFYNKIKDYISEYTYCFAIHIISFDISKMYQIDDKYISLIYYCFHNNKDFDANILDAPYELTGNNTMKIISSDNFILLIKEVVFDKTTAKKFCNLCVSFNNHYTNKHS